MTTPSDAPIPRSVASAEWRGWRARDRATLVFVIRAGAVLLIHKKRGLGAGKINGPGGKLDPGETPLACAVREVEEELCVTPLGLDERGRLRFQFLDGYGLDVHVFAATDCRGAPRETDEARPLWTDLDRIPYERMWPDDRLWLPLLLAGQRFSGRFIYAGDEMRDHLVEVVD